MKDSDEMIAEFVHSNDIELIEGCSIPVREKWFTHYRRRSWTIRNGTKEVLFIGDLKIHIKEVTPDSFPRYTEIAMSCVWGTVINRSGFVPRLAFYARPSTGGDPVKLYEHDWDYLGFTCGGGEYVCTRRWGDKNYFDEINFVDVLMPREFTFKDPPCDEQVLKKMGFDPIYSKRSKINVSVVGRLVTTDTSLIAETVAAVLNGVDCEMLDQQPRV